MLMIRFQRFGRKNDPAFRVVLTDKRNAPKSGKFLEVLGFKNPKTKEKKLDVERIKYWISKGAKTSATVHNLFISEKIFEGKKINVVPRPTSPLAHLLSKEMGEEKKESPSPLQGVDLGEVKGTEDIDKPQE